MSESQKAGSESFAKGKKFWIWHGTVAKRQENQVGSGFMQWVFSGTYTSSEFLIAWAKAGKTFGHKRPLWDEVTMTKDETTHKWVAHSLLNKNLFLGLSECYEIVLSSVQRDICFSCDALRQWLWCALKPDGWFNSVWIEIQWNVFLKPQCLIEQK